MINIDNDKKVVQPYVSVDGNWCTVQKEAVMADGEWQTVFEKNTYNIHLYIYGVYYKTLTCEKGKSVTLVSVSNVYCDDIVHNGWSLTYGDTERKYAAAESFRPTSDLTLHAQFRYFKETFTSTLDVTSVATQQKFTSKNYGPSTIDIEGCIEQVTSNVSDGTVISTAYEAYQLHTDGTAPYVKVNNTYVEGTLGGADGATVLSVPIVLNDVVYACGIAEQNDSDSSGNDVKSTLKLAVHYKTYGTGYAYRTVKE